jgi:hypothetical protein
MRSVIGHSPKAFLVPAIFLSFLASGCGGSYEETISGVKIPVPKAMTRRSEKPVEMTFLGFGAGQASFHGAWTMTRSLTFIRRKCRRVAGNPI